MKKMMLFLCCMSVFVCYSQTILTVKLPSKKKTAPTQISPDKKRAIDSLNKKLKDIKENPNTKTLAALRAAIYDTSLAGMPEVESMKLNKIMSKNSLISSLLPINIDSIKIESDSNAPSIESLCPKLKNTTIRYFLGDKEAYIGVIEDTSGNALQSFTIVQSNRELFYDKLTKALSSLCDSTDAINSIISGYKASDPDLYTQYLENKEELANTNGLAGTLVIYKHTAVHYMPDNPPKNDSSNIGSVHKAKKLSRRSMKETTKLKIQLDSMANAAKTYAKKSIQDSIVANEILRISQEVDRNVDLANLYLDLINNKISKTKTFYYYNKSIDLSREAQDEANKAIDAIRNVIRRVEIFKSISKPDFGEIIPDPSESGQYYTIHAAFNSKKRPNEIISASYRENDLNQKNKYDNPYDIPTIPMSENNPLYTNNAIVRSYNAQLFQPSDTTMAGDVFLNPAIADFTIQEIQIQFQDGFIENIKVFGKVKGNLHLLRFENVYPIGFSTKKDFRNLIDVSLFEKSDYRTNSRMFLNLAEVISYNQNLTNDNKDYSPANQVITIKALSDSIKEVTLYKDQTSKILELQVFSDLKGADNNNPNGLIQVELNKRLNFLSKRDDLTWKIVPWHWCNGKHYENIGNFGFFNFITPQFTIDKIEDNQKRLVLNSIDTLSLAADTSKPITYASTINLLQHQIYSVGFDLSLFLIDLPSIKSTINFGTGIHFGRSAIQDTLRSRNPIDSAHFIFKASASNNVLQYGVNTFQWGPYITWQIFPDSRFGVIATQRFTWFKALSSNFIQVRDSAHFLKFIAQTPKDQIRTTAYSYYDYTRSNGWISKNIASPFSLFTKCIASAEIFAYFNPSSTGNNKLFFRYRFNWDLANPRENFHQMQVGFSTYITATKEYDKLKKAANID